MTLSSGTGVISGTPSSAGTFNFTVRVTDSAITSGAVTTKALSIAVAPALVITTSSLPGGVTGSAYSQSVANTGGTPPIAWSLASGALPAGLNLNSGTGTISGTASASGTFSFTVRATDGAGATDTKALSIVITPPLSITTSSVPGGSTGISYLASLVATGGTAPYSWAISTGSLPNGLSVNASTGAISGTPTTVGSFNFTVRVSDAAGATASKALSIAVVIPLSITTTTLPSGTAGTAYSATLAATGGTAPYSWMVTVGLLPVGLTLNTNTGGISGTPTTPGISNITVQVTDRGDPARTAIQTLSITLNEALSIATTAMQGGSVGVTYSQNLTAKGGTPPYSWSISTGSIPTGLSLNANSGLISGSPSVAGTFNFTVRVSDSVASVAASKALTINIDSGSGGSSTLTISSSSTLPSGTSSFGYSQSLNATGGVLPYSWSITTGALPTGLLLNSVES